jgi:histone-lysine N-methyltransferase SETMAR
MGWTVLPRPLYSPDLTPSDFHIFGPLKDALRGRRFADDDELKHSVREELRRFSKEFYATGIQRLTQRWKKCVDNEGDFVEK